jgi:hypothetical protein
MLVGAGICIQIPPFWQNEFEFMNENSRRVDAAHIPYATAGLFWFLRLR